MVMLTEVTGEGDLPDVQRQGERHLDRNNRLVKALRGGLISDICVRFHHANFRAPNLEATNEKVGEFRQDLIALEGRVSFDNGRAKFRKIISQYRLVISGYDGTGFLELLAHDFPTIMLVGEDFGSWLTPSARADYGKLIEAKLLFTDPEALAVHVVKIWHDVDSWWKSAPVEIAKENFGRGYSQANKNKVKEIAAIIRDFQNP